MLTSNVLITGGTGFVGYWMIKTKPERLGYVALNRHEYETSRWHEKEFDYIVHLAPVSPTRALEFAKRNNARMLYASSGAFYHPTDDYGLNKRHWEYECLAGGIDVVIARLFTFFGKRLDDNKAITQFFSAARAGKPLQVWGDGSAIRSYMHGAEMGRLLWRILLHGRRGEAYDVGSDRPITIKRLAERIKAFTGAQIEYIDKAVPMLIYLPPDTNKVKNLL